MDDAAFTGAPKSRQETIRNMKEDARESFVSGKRVLMRMRPFVDIPRTSLDMKFYLNPIKLVFDGITTEIPREFKTEDIKVSLHLCLVSLNPATSVDYMKRLEKRTAMYPIVHTEMRQFPFDKGVTYREIINPFNGKVPQKVVIGIVNTLAFNGEYEFDPYAFEKAGVEYIKQVVNGEEYPYETMDLNAGNGNKDLVQYQRFCDAAGCFYRNHGNMVRFDDWGQGKNCTLFVFSNVAHGGHDDATLLPRNEAFIHIQIKASSQSEQKTIIIYAEYEGMVEIQGTKEGTTLKVQ